MWDSPACYTNSWHCSVQSYLNTVMVSSPKQPPLQTTSQGQYDIAETAVKMVTCVSYMASPPASWREAFRLSSPESLISNWLSLTTVSHLVSLDSNLIKHQSNRNGLCPPSDFSTCMYFVGAKLSLAILKDSLRDSIAILSYSHS